jgi:hypothetical protein
MLALAQHGRAGPQDTVGKIGWYVGLQEGQSVRRERCRGCAWSPAPAAKMGGLLQNEAAIAAWACSIAGYTNRSRTYHTMHPSEHQPFYAPSCVNGKAAELLQRSRANQRKVVRRQVFARVQHLLDDLWSHSIGRMPTAVDRPLAIFVKTSVR